MTDQEYLAAIKAAIAAATHVCRAAEDAGLTVEYERSGMRRALIHDLADVHRTILMTRRIK